MNRIKLCFLIQISILLFSCSSVASIDEAKKTAIIEEVQKNPDIPIADLEQKVIEIIEMPAETLLSEAPPSKGATAKISEYEKAIGSLVDVSVTEDQYQNDKKDILDCIDKLDVIMKNRDYASWLSYLSAESIQYWSDTRNLKLAAARLPIKNLQINNLRDYFIYIFIPARQGRVISEIRYISPDLVKAVQTIGESDIIYYHFLKSENQWKIHLDRLEN